MLLEGCLRATGRPSDPGDPSSFLAFFLELERDPARPGLLCAGEGFPGWAFSLEWCDGSCFRGFTVKSPSFPVSCVPWCVEGDGFSFLVRLWQFLEVHESGHTASALSLPHCLICWPQGLHTGDVTIAALEIMKLIMNIALLDMPFQRGDSRLLKPRIEKFKSNQSIADNFRVLYQAVL